MLISTYNWVPALRLCLESVRTQSVLPDEIIIADDGSGEETEALIDWYRTIFQVPLLHVWQPDNGYQLARIRNKAFAAASGDYIIQIDGDLILHPHFVRDHLAARKPGTFVSGARSMITKEVTEQLLHPDSSQTLIKWSNLEQKYNAIPSRTLSALNYLFQRGNKNVHYVLGCNMAFWKADLLKVNGYNEDFTGWGKEDNDIAIRLVNSGIKLRFLKFGGIIYHLFHKMSTRLTLVTNEELFKNSIANKVTYIAKGINQYSSDSINRSVCKRINVKNK